MYGSADFVTPIIVILIGAAINLLILYFLIKAAVTEALKQHTRWQVANRMEIEAKYAKKMPSGSTTPRGPGAPPSIPPTAPRN